MYSWSLKYVYTYAQCGAYSNCSGVQLIEMSSVPCFCARQQAAKEQRAQSITSRSRQARFLFDYVIQMKNIL
jgi:hypothetical protein